MMERSHDHKFSHVGNGFYFSDVIIHVKCMRFFSRGTKKETFLGCVHICGVDSNPGVLYDMVCLCR